MFFASLYYGELWKHSIVLLRNQGTWAVKLASAECASLVDMIVWQIGGGAFD